MPTRPSPLAVLEAAYDLEATDRTWLQGVAEQLAGAVLPKARDVFGVRFDVGRTPRQPWEPPFVLRRGGSALEAVSTFLPVDSPERVARTFGGPNGWRGLEELTRGDAQWERGAERFRRQGHGELVVVNCSDATGRGLALFGTFDGSVPAVSRPRVSRLAAHVAAAHRLRAALVAAQPKQPEAVLTPDGRLLDAQGEARGGTARQALQRHAQRVDRARSRKGRSVDPLDVWTALVEGRWSLVDRFERDGRRFLVALENAPDLRVRAPLAPKARAVLGLVVKGHSTKLIAYELGLTEAGVAWHIKQLVRYFSVSSRRALLTALRPFARVEPSP